MPLGAEANQGQTDSQVKFLARGSGYTLFLTGRRNRAAIAERRSRNEDRGTKIARRRSILDPQSSIFNRSDEALGANPNPQAAGLDELQGKSNYFIGADPQKWRTNVPTYAKAKFGGLSGSGRGLLRNTGTTVGI